MLRLIAGSSSFARVVSTRFFSSASNQRTPLYEWHVKQGGRMVGFAGWEMPVQYKESIIESHLHTRTNASLFDVSHMCQLIFTGPDRERFIERITVGYASGIKVGTGTLSLITNERGGIIDDTVFNRHADKIYMVVNAGCAEKDLVHIKSELSKWNANGGTVKMTQLTDQALVALQGPKAAAVLSRHASADFKQWAFMDSREIKVAGIPAILTRCGYTGEDGFEISVPADKVESLASLLVSESEVLPAGLGARDSLRLEAGLCLYGHELNEDTSPVDAGLMWTIDKARRQDATFIGAEAILNKLKAGPSSKRVGLLLDNGICRENAPIVNESGEQVGVVTSGSFSPSLKKGVAMGYVTPDQSKVGTKLKVGVRERFFPATVTKLPFVPTHYYKPPLAN